jgi:hypothetical protein
MDHFAGLDVSVKETSICIVDDAGKYRSALNGLPIQRRQCTISRATRAQCRL